jgi:3-phenylpropionate/cinnamic acid dioxygenase small subunit
MRGVRAAQAHPRCANIFELWKFASSLAQNAKTGYNVAVARERNRRHMMKTGSARARTTRVAAAAVLSLMMVGDALGQAKKDDATARMKAIEDRQAIEQLLMGDYPRALDSANWVAYGALFTKDGELIMQGGATKRTGPAAITEFFTKLPALGGQAAPTGPSACPVPQGTPRTMHVVTNLSLHIDGDTATDQAYWETIATRDCKSVVAGAGHYEDVLKREDGKWRFAKREIFDDLPPRTTAVAPASSKQ